MIKSYNPSMLVQRPVLRPTAFNVNSDSLLHGTLPETYGISKDTADFLYKAAQDPAYAGNAAKEFAGIVKDTILPDDKKDNIPLIKDSNGNPTFNYGTSAGDISSYPVSPDVFDYLNAELAQHYGMGRSTAYQEALSNTAYQRAVKDMQAAGLNPAAIFGSGKGYTAGGVGYVDPGSSGGGSGRSSGSGSSKKLLSEGMYYGLSTAVGLATAALTKNPANYWIGSYATQGALGALNSMFKK